MKGFASQLAQFKGAHPSSEGALALLVHANLNPDSAFHQKIVSVIASHLLHTAHLQGTYSFEELNFAYTAALTQIQEMGRQRLSEILRNVAAGKVVNLQNDAADVQILHAFGLAHEADTALELAEVWQKSTTLAKNGANFLLRNPSLEAVPAERLDYWALTHHLSLPARAMVAQKAADIVHTAVSLHSMLEHAPPANPTFVKNIRQVVEEFLRGLQDPQCIEEQIERLRAALAR